MMLKGSMAQRLNGKAVLTVVLNGKLEIESYFF
jgi:hypothetical protein